MARLSLHAMHSKRQHRPKTILILLIRSIFIALLGILLYNNSVVPSHHGKFIEIIVFLKFRFLGMSFT